MQLCFIVQVTRRVPSCNARRAHDSAIHLLERVLPRGGVTPMDPLVPHAGALLSGQGTPSLASVEAVSPGLLAPNTHESSLTLTILRRS